MAVFTKPSQTQLKDILECYGLPPLVSAKGLADGVENTTYLLECETGKYILTIFERRVSETDLPFFKSVLDHLRHDGIICPAILPTLAGKTHLYVEGKLCIIQTCLEGRVVDSPDLLQIQQAGEQLGRMQCIASRLDISRPNPLGIEQWETLLGVALSGAGSEWQARIPTIQAIIGQAKSKPPNNLPKGPIHADYFPDNVFFKDTGDIAVIDFFLGCSDSYAYDLAIALIAWGFDADGKLDILKINAFMQGYKMMRKLSKSEADALPLLCQIGALRIIATRLHDIQFRANPSEKGSKPPEPYWQRIIDIQEAQRNGFFNQITT